MLQFGNWKLSTYRSVLCVNIFGLVSVIQKKTIMEAERKDSCIISQLIQKCNVMLALGEEKKRNLSCMIFM
jgi:hypothetical protein